MEATNMSTKLCKFEFGGTDDSRFGEPMLWIGLYVAVASILCAAAMAVDIVRSFRWSKYWVSPKFFVFNAAVLTILGVAVKIPNDINGKMPGRLDQLAKLSGILLICVAMNHAMPSLGVMNKWELVSNMTALGILVISTAVNVWFQIKTKVITRYASLHTVYTIIMLFMYSLLVTHSLRVAPIKRFLEKKYDSKHREILGEVGQNPSTDALKEYVKKYWLMALTSSPGYVLRNFGMFATCAILYGSLLCTFGYSLWLSFRTRAKGCYVNSDYKWSAGLVFGIQAIPVLAIGIVSVIFRTASSYLTFWKDMRGILRSEKFRLQPLENWKKGPLPFHVRNKAARTVAYHAKNMGVNLLILFVRITMSLNRIVLIIFSVIFTCILAILVFPCILLISFYPSPPTSPVSPVSPVVSHELTGYILHLDQDEDAKDIVEDWKNYPDRWFQSGRARCPHHLHDLIKNMSESFSFTSIFGDCWSLHIATLTCIVHVAFIETNQREGLNSLIQALEEGWLYLMLVDRNSGVADEETPDMARTRDTAQMVWEKLLIQEVWLDIPLKRLADGRSLNDVIQHLQENATSRKGGEEEERANISELPFEVIAARSMCSVTSALLGDGNALLSSYQLRSEVVAAVKRCLACLPRAILRECSRGSYGSREEHVRLAAQVLGETETILKIFERTQDSRPLNIYRSITF